MTKKDWIKYINDTYDNIILSFSGGKDSLGMLSYSSQVFDTDKIQCLFIDSGNWDMPECYAQIIYAMEKTGCKCLIERMPTDFTDLGKRLGNMTHQALWCRPYDKFPTIDHAQASLKTKNTVIFEGARRDETTTRYHRHWFDPAKNEESMPTFRPVLDFTNQQICDQCVKTGYPLIPAYECMDRSSCTCCAEKTPYVWGIFRKFYPNIFRRYLEYLEACSCSEHWTTYYARFDIEKAFRVEVTKDNFDTPHTAGYTSMENFDKYLGVKMQDIRDDPYLQIEELYERCDIQPALTFQTCPMPDNTQRVLNIPAGDPILKLTHLFDHKGLKPNEQTN
jgi:3'-phosphoadenosine 5'-phosphosulfate sulfotransferase (PAPS reductase)/FAD synthetase